MEILYKDGVASEPLHSVDVEGWLKAGWKRPADKPTEPSPRKAPKPPPDSIILYKDGEQSPILHTVDAGDWIKAGWSKQAPAEIAIESVDDDGTEDPEAIARGEAIALLSAIPSDEWRTIRKLARAYLDNPEKPEEGWSALIPDIVEAGFRVDDDTDFDEDDD